jgi:hypothetical protein
MNRSDVSSSRCTLLSATMLLCTLMHAGVHAENAVVGWVEKPDFSAFRIVRDEHELPTGIADLQACDIVQLQNDQATVRITLAGYQRIQLDATALDHKVQVPCAETSSWYGKSLALVRVISGLATAPAANSEVLTGTRTHQSSTALKVPALGPYNPLLVAGERALYLSWNGGVPPYTVTLQRYGGGNLVEQNNIQATAVRLPTVQLKPGRYVLVIQGSDKYAIKEDSVTVVNNSKLPPPPKALTDARLSKADRLLLYAYYLEGWGQGEWTLEALQRAAAIKPVTPAVSDWLQGRFVQEVGVP